MKSKLLAFTLIGSCVLAAVTVALQISINRLQSERDGMMRTPETKRAPRLRPRSSSAHNPELAKLQAEIQQLEIRLAATSARTPVPNRDITQGSVRLMDLRNAGHDTPSAAFETLIWAMARGDDAALINSIAIGESDRQQMLGYFAAIGEKTKTPELVAGMLFAKQILKEAESFHILGSTQVDATHVKLHTKEIDLAEEEHTAELPMVLGPGGWKLQIPEGIASALEQEMRRKAPGTP